MIVAMVRNGRPKAELVLTDAEREQLVRWSRRAKSSQALALRSRIVLACADGRPKCDSEPAAGAWFRPGRVAGNGSEQPTTIMHGWSWYTVGL